MKGRIVTAYSGHTGLHGFAAEAQTIVWSLIAGNQSSSLWLELRMEWLKLCSEVGG